MSRGTVFPGPPWAHTPHLSAVRGAPPRGGSSRREPPKAGIPQPLSTDPDEFYSNIVSSPRFRVSAGGGAAALGTPTRLRRGGPEGKMPTTQPLPLSLSPRLAATWPMSCVGPPRTPSSGLEANLGVGLSVQGGMGTSRVRGPTDEQTPPAGARVWRGPAPFSSSPSLPLRIPCKQTKHPLVAASARVGKGGHEESSLGNHYLTEGRRQSLAGEKPAFSRGLALPPLRWGGGGF